MDAEDSDADFDDAHVRALCFDVVNTRFHDVQLEADKIVGSSVKSALQEETASITAAFQAKFDRCMAACKKDMDEFPKRMDQQIMAVLQRCDEIRGEIMQVDAKVTEHDRLLGEMQNQIKELQVQTQAGGTTRLHISGDKNPKQIEAEITGRKLRAKLQEAYGSEQKIFFDRDRGWLSLGWDAPCKIEVFPGRGETKILRNPGPIAKYGKSKDLLVEAVGG
ncbi:unnamed protein product, partial [Prorocentrum cordatum]